MVLALVGVLNGISTTRALIPLPIQPFASDALGGVNTTQLGVDIAQNWTVTQTLQGERSSLPWIFSAPGFSVDPDDGNYAKVLGTVWTNIDALCDGTIDYMAGTATVDPCKYPPGPSPYKPWLDPLKWVQATADRDNLPAADQFLVKIMPPWPWIARHEVTIDHLCLGDGGGSAATFSVLNTVYAQIPFSSAGINDGCPQIGGGSESGLQCKNGVDDDGDAVPGGNKGVNDGCPQIGATSEGALVGKCANDIDDDADTAFVAQTKLGGSPLTPPSSVCLDTPQGSESITTLYNNPPLLGNTGGPTGDGGRDLDDGSGLYARWTILQSQGSSSLAKAGDLRKSYTGSPSIPSDIGYVERIIDLQCFWMDDNGCAGCDGADPDTAISEVESWNDLDLAALGGYGTVDSDGDCLIQQNKAQPGQPAEQTSTSDEPTGVICGSTDGWVDYSENPILVRHDKAADSDCDGLVTGIEVAYGTNPADDDSDGDGASDFVEMFQFTNPIGLGSTDTDGDGYLDKPAGVYQNDGTGRTLAGALVPTDTSVDNCPTVANPSQLNTDGKRRANGPQIGDNAAADFASNPNQDKLGDACDDDDDNDGATDTYELDTTGGGGAKLASDPLNPDDDNVAKIDGIPQGDRVIDGAEWRVAGGAPLNKLVFPAWTNAQQQYYRGCNINVPDQGSFPAPPYPTPGLLWDEEYDQPPPAVDNDIEMDADGDGIVCPADPDSDNGTGTRAVAAEEITDDVEGYCYGTGLANKDSDGDGCPDWVEIVDINGNRTVNVVDVLLFARRAFGIYPTSSSDPLFDVNCNRVINVVDVLTAARNSALLKPATATCTTAEN